MDDNQSLMEQAVAAARQRDFVSARTFLARLLKQEPNNLNAWLLAAHVVEKRSDAVSCYKQVLRLDPGHAYARQKLSQLQSEPPASVPSGPPRDRPVPVRDDRNTPAIRPLHVRPETSPPPIVNPPQVLPLRARPEISPPQIVTPPPALPSQQKAPKSDTRAGLQLLLGILTVVLCLAVVGIVFVSRGGQLLKPANPTPTSEQLFDVLYRNSRAANEKNIAAYMATIHPKSSAYRQTEELLPQLFSAYNLEFYYYDLKVTSLKTNEAQVHFSLSTRRLSGPAFRNNIVIGTMILRPDEGVWKIYNQKVEDVQYY